MIGLVIVALLGWIGTTGITMRDNLTILCPTVMELKSKVDALQMTCVTRKEVDDKLEVLRGEAIRNSRNQKWVPNTNYPGWLVPSSDFSPTNKSVNKI